MNRIKLILHLTLLSLGLLLLVAGCDDGPPKFEDNSPKEDRTTGNPAIDKLNLKINGNPKDPELYFARAQAYYDIEGYDEAIGDMFMAMEIDSVNIGYHHFLADIYLDYYKSRLALKTMIRAASLAPERIPTLLKLAEFQLILKQNDESLKTISKILKVDPQNAEGFYMMGLNFVETKDSARAINSLQTAVENDPDLLEAWVILGNLFDKRNNPIAIKYFDNALRIDPNNIDAVEAKAMHLYNVGKLNESIASYKSIQKIDRTYADPFYNIGLIYMELDSVPQAHDHFNIAVELDPTFKMAYYGRGLCAESKGDFKSARNDYEQVLNMDPNFLRAQKSLEELKNKQLQ